jgi:hypothetical protein
VLVVNAFAGPSGSTSYPPPAPPASTPTTAPTPTQPPSCAVKDLPARLVLKVGDHTALPTHVVDENSPAVVQNAANWTVEDTNLAEVTAARVVGKSAGQTTLTARFCGTSASVPLTIVPLQASAVPWQEQLFSNTCEGQCSAGSACTTAADGKKDCLTGFTCVLGNGEEQLESSGAWTVHLSNIVQRGVDDSCRSLDLLWACARGTRRCVSQKQACIDGTKSGRIVGFANDGIPITGQEMANRSFTLDVRQDSPNGPVIATTNPIPLPQRKSLCRGMSVRATPADDAKIVVLAVKYFLLPVRKAEH